MVSHGLQIHCGRGITFPHTGGRRLASCIPCGGVPCLGRASRCHVKLRASIPAYRHVISSRGQAAPSPIRLGNCTLTEPPIPGSLQEAPPRQAVAVAALGQRVPSGRLHSTVCPAVCLPVCACLSVCLSGTAPSTPPSSSSSRWSPCPVNNSHPSMTQPTASWSRQTR